MIGLGCGGRPDGAEAGARGSASSPPTGLPSAVAEACAPYADRPDVLGWCIRGAVEALASPDEARAACAAAGHWQARCRQAWVDGHLADPDLGIDLLLSVCGDAADCALRVLDARPAGEIALQVRRCRERAPAYAVDCTRHAMQRWLARRPDADALRAACAIGFPDVDDAGRWLAWPVACQGVGRCCEAPASLAAACERGVAELRADPRRCAAGPLGTAAGGGGEPAPASEP